MIANTLDSSGEFLWLRQLFCGTCASKAATRAKKGYQTSTVKRFTYRKDAAPFCHIPGGEQELCCNEIATKHNRDYLRKE